MKRDIKVIKDLMLHKLLHLCTNFVLVFVNIQLLMAPRNSTVEIDDIGDHWGPFLYILRFPKFFLCVGRLLEGKPPKRSKLKSTQSIYCLLIL